MLDQRIIRENPTLITNGLHLRGVEVDLTPLQLMAQKQQSLEDQRNKLQAESNRIGKEVGERIKKGSDPKSKEIS